MKLRERLREALLYVIVDRRFEKRIDFPSLIPLLARAGVDIIQLREKRLNKAMLKEKAQLLRDLCRANNLLFIMNDYPELAAELDCDGVHVGGEDCSVLDARKIVGEGKLVGWSARSIETALRGEAAGADYLGVGAVFPTSTKRDAKMLSEIMLQRIANTVSIPVFAIGGINSLNVARLIELGIRRIAVCQALLEAEDIEKTARFLKMRLSARI